MISEIQIENFKSIAKLSLKPGRVTVLIGENGSGKSNILEAVAFAAAASVGKLDDEFLYNRGIRVTEENWMRSALLPKESQFIRLRAICEDEVVGMTIHAGGVPAEFLGTSGWQVRFDGFEAAIEEISNTPQYRSKISALAELLSPTEDKFFDDLAAMFARSVVLDEISRQLAPHNQTRFQLKDFLIYSPENSVLRNFSTEGAIKPLGPKGEGLLKLLQNTAKTGNGRFASDLKENLALLGWFGDLRLPTDSDEIQGQLRIRDRFLAADGPLFDQRSANEGFLYLLFYFTLFLSPLTPRFFAIDNLDNALNPKLCAELMRQLCLLAERGGKQVIITTHNPAILDGLNLHDDMQRLLVVRRNSEGHTVVERVSPPRPRPDGATTRLSTAFMSGLLGGLPDHF